MGQLAPGYWLNDILNVSYGISETLDWFTIIIHHDIPTRELGRNIKCILRVFIGIPMLVGDLGRQIGEIIFIENVMGFLL